MRQVALKTSGAYILLGHLSSEQGTAMISSLRGTRELDAWDDGDSKDEAVERVVVTAATHRESLLDASLGAS